MLFDAEPSDVISSIRRDPDFGTDVLTSVILAFDGRRDFHLLDPTGGRSASSHLRDCGSARRRDPVQHPAGSSHPRPVGIRWDPRWTPMWWFIKIPAADQYRVQADAFSRAIRDDTPVPTPPQDAIANIEVMERIFADAAARAWSRVNRTGARVTRRVGDDLRDGELRRADQWGIGSEPAGGDIRDVTRGIECAEMGAFEDGFLQEWEERVIEPAEHYQLRVEDVDQVADSQAEPSTDLGEGIQSLLVADIRPRNDCVQRGSAR